MTFTCPHRFSVIFQHWIIIFRKLWSHNCNGVCVWIEKRAPARYENLYAPTVNAVIYKTTSFKKNDSMLIFTVFTFIFLQQLWFFFLPCCKNNVPLTEERLEQQKYALKIVHNAIISNYTILFFILLPDACLKSQGESSMIFEENWRKLYSYEADLVTGSVLCVGYQCI